MAASVYPTQAPAVHTPRLRDVPSIVRVGSLSATAAVWERLVHASRAMGLVVREAWRPGQSEPAYSVSTGFDRPGVSVDVDTWRCSCWYGQHGMVCVHVASLLYSLSGQKMLRRCAICDRWEYRGHGEYRHVGGQADRWECTSCLGGGAA